MAQSPSGGRGQAPRGPRIRGFTLIEVMISMAILAIAIVGALGGFLEASKLIAQSQVTEYKSLLLDASAQRWMMASKSATSPLVAGVNGVVPVAASTCTAECATLGIGVAPWVPDPSTIKAGDLSTGAYFTITPAGAVVPLASASATCAGLPVGSYCREWLVTTSKTPIVASHAIWGATWPPAAQPTLSALTSPPTVYTLWLRVSKVGDLLANAVYFSTSFVP